jgi:hypothetical protein
MSMRLFLLAAVVYFAPKAVSAKTIETETLVAPIEQSEEITHKRGLAVHMGLTPTDVLFGKPRSFRSESLNNFGLDPITDEEP